MKKVLARAFSGLIYLFLYLPILVVILFSFNTSRRNVIFEGFTTIWYPTLLTNTPLLNALQNSLIVASVSTLLAAVIGSMAAVAMFRYKFFGRNIIDSLLYIPVVVPEIVLGIALLSIFSITQVPLGLITLTIAHATFSIPFVVFTVRARLAGFDRSVEEAAADLGANNRKVFLGITVPIIAPGIVAGAALAFTLSFDDIIISFFTTGASTQTFPLKVLEYVRTGVRPDVYALSTIIMFATIAIVLISQTLSYRAGLKKLK